MTREISGLTRFTRIRRLGKFTSRVLEDGENISEEVTLMQETDLLGLRQILKHPIQRSITWKTEAEFLALQLVIWQSN